MPNLPRPKCPTCDTAMARVHTLGPRGVSFLPFAEGFACRPCHTLALGRERPKYLGAAR